MGAPFPWSAEPAGSRGQAVALHLGVILLSVLLLLLPGTWGDCTAPAQSPFAMPTNQIHDSSFPVGTSLQYKCRPGYFKKQFNITCQENSVWTSAENICKRKSCPTPSDPQNGVVHVNTDTQFGSSIHYTCNIGYRLIGSFSAACIISDETVVWDTDPPICERIPCEPPPAIANGEFLSPTGEDFEFGTVVTYQCNLGVRREKLFELVGEPSIYCTTNDSQVGVWSGPPPQCIERNKCLPPLIENAVMVSENKGLFSLRDVVEFRCQPGFVMKGSSRVQCQARNKWEPELPTCSKGHCTAPVQFTFARPTSQIHESTFPFGTSLQYECLPGYFKKQFNITCQETLVWTSAENICKRKSCTSPSAPPNGMVHVDTDTQFGSSIHYTCNTGYHLIGSSSAACTVSGETVVWGPDPPICERVKCSFSQFMSGIKKELDIRTEYQYGDNVTVECEDGYKLDSSPHSQCQADGSWYPPLPKCIPRSRAGLIAGVICGTLFFIFAGIFSFRMIRKHKKRSLHNSEELEATQESLNPQVDKGNVHNGSQCSSKETHHELYSTITDEKSKEVNDSPEDGCVQPQTPLNNGKQQFY